MKLLLYCTKAKPYLVQGVAKPMHTLDATNPFNFNWKLVNKGFSNDRLNGKIVAECDFEVEEIFRDFIDGKDYTINPNGVWVKSYYFKTKTLYANELYSRCCLTFEQIYNYFDNKDDKLVGYAIHIKNLHIFDEPKYLDELWTFDKQGLPNKIEKAPQNMMKCHIIKPMEIEEYILISIYPEWLCKILNGEKTIEVRKKILKEMLK